MTSDNVATASEVNKKHRADQLLVQKGLSPSIEQARRSILAGQVRVGSDHVVQGANEMILEDAPLHIKAPYPYVSRGADKLLPALDAHLPKLNGLVALDIGASTGGFTDLMLQRGASRVYAVDVGTAQLHLKLREDPRVVCMEKTNARHLTASDLPQQVDLVTADVSFISLRRILPAAVQLAAEHAWFFLLIKPQFEARREEVAKGGVVRDESIRQRVVDEIVDFAATLGLSNIDLCLSPIRGPKGNQETVGVFRIASSKSDE
ncbi:MAG TPA: TlyA family rRNA (cytidine-2'-O)-methyltransferase [Lentisphaeria bacterium]|nr:TlyA family rRNA (cytidine-2'-O)-methyltransferase [Lentisphaeria bacterium]